MFKKVVSLMCAALMLIPFAGCSTQQDENFPAAVGHEQFDSAVNRAVVLSDNAADIILQMEYEAKIVGRSDECTQAAVSDVDSVGKKSRPDIDKIVSSTPDVVIADSTLSDESYNKLKEKGLKVLRFADVESMDELSLMYQKLDTLFEGMEKGAENGASYYGRLNNALSENSKALPDVPMPKTVCYLYDYEGTTVTGDMFIGSAIFTNSGATNIAQNLTGGKMDIAQIVEANPQYIFCDTGMKDMLKKNADFKNLLAVKNNRVVEIPAANLSRGGVSMLEAVKIITDTLYPNGETGSVADNYGIVYDEETFYTLGSGADTDEYDVDGERNNIIIIQTRLDDLGYWPLNEMTGYYGETTAIAVAEFQSANNMEYVTGEVDSDTLDKMFSESAVSRSEPIEKQSLE